MARKKRMEYVAVADRNSGDEVIIGKYYRGLSVWPICRYNIANGRAIGTEPPPPLHRARAGDVIAEADTFLGIVVRLEQLRNKINTSEGVAAIVYTTQYLTG